MPVRAGSSLLSALRLGGSSIARVYAGASLVFDAAPAFDPLTLAPSLWIDAADAATLSLVDGRVAQASDKSGHGRHAVQATAANQPGYTASHAVANNRPALFAASPNSGLTTDASVPIEEVFVVAAFNTGAETLFTRNQAPSGWTTGYTGLFGGTGNNGAPRMMGDENTANFIGSGAFSATGGYRNRETALRGAPNATGAAVILPLPLSVLRFRRQASAVFDSRRHLMTQTPGSGRAWPGPWCEFIAFPAAPAEADRNRLVEHLIAKWGIAA